MAIRQEILWKQLDRNIPSHACVTRKVDLAHTSLANRADDLVAPELRAYLHKVVWLSIDYFASPQSSTRETAEPGREAASIQPGTWRLARYDGCQRLCFNARR